MVNSDFQDFVNKKAAAAEADVLDLPAELGLWQEKLNSLFSDVGTWLKPQVDAGLMKIVLEDVILTEEQLGSYKASAASIILGASTVKMMPVGTFLIGARGRVDMTGPRGNAVLMIVPPNASAPKVTVTVRSAGQPADAIRIPAPPPPREWVWKIVNRLPRISYIELNQESFEMTLMSVFGD